MKLLLILGVLCGVALSGLSLAKTTLKNECVYAKKTLKVGEVFLPKEQCVRVTCDRVDKSVMTTVHKCTVDAGRKLKTKKGKKPHKKKGKKLQKRMGKKHGTKKGKKLEAKKGNTLAAKKGKKPEAKKGALYPDCCPTPQKKS